MDTEVPTDGREFPYVVVICVLVATVVITSIGWACSACPRRLRKYVRDILDEDDFDDDDDDEGYDGTVGQELNRGRGRKRGRGRRNRWRSGRRGRFGGESTVDCERGGGDGNGGGGDDGKHFSRNAQSRAPSGGMISVPLNGVAVDAAPTHPNASARVRAPRHASAYSTYTRGAARRIQRPTSTSDANYLI